MKGLGRHLVVGGQPPPPPNQNFTANAVKNFSSTANFSTGGTNGLSMNDGEWQVWTFTLDVQLPGGLASVGFNNPGNTNEGWNLIVNGGDLQFFQYGAGATQGTIDTGQLRKQLNRLVIIQTGGNLRGSLNGAAVVVGAVTTIFPPTGASTFKLGATIFGSAALPGKLVEVAWGKLADLPGGTLSDAQLRGYSTVQPVPAANQPPNLAYYSVNGSDHGGISGGGGRWYAQKTLTSLARIYLRAGDDWNGIASTVTTEGSTPKTWTVNLPATLAVDTSLSETLIQNMGAIFSDTIKPTRNGFGRWLTDPQARVVWTQPSGFNDICYGYTNNDPTAVGTTTAEVGGIYVGASGDTVESATNYLVNTPPSPTNDGNIYTYWVNQNGVTSNGNGIELASGVSPTLHPIWFYQGGQSIAGGIVYGGYFQWVVIPTSAVAGIGPATPNKVWIYDGDSIPIGINSPSPPAPPLGGLVPRKRRIFPTAGGPGSVIMAGYSGRMLFDNHGAFTTLAAQMAARAKASGATNVSHYIELGINDYLNAPQPVAGFGSDLQTYVNALAAAYAALSLTATIYVQMLIQPHWDAVMNARGDTGANYRTVQAAITSATIEDVRNPNAVAYQPDNVHPTTAGQNAMTLNVQAVANG